MDAIVLAAGSTSFDGLELVERPVPEPGPGQVLIRLQAASLNYRDLLVATGRYFGGPVENDVVPLSDGAGVVEETGANVERFSVGDRVTNTFSQVPPSAGPFADRVPLGSPLDGTLVQYRVFYENGLVPVPETLSLEKAATLPCAGQTAWHALFGAGRPVQPGETVLTLGTGGVSTFALLFAKAAGARVIITSSSNEKLERVRALGADETINYVETPDWHEVVRSVTDGRGVDCVVETGGAGTLERSMESLAPEGKIGLIGVLSHTDENPDPYGLMPRRGHLHGIYVGDIQRPLASFKTMNNAIDANRLEPVVDRTFSLDDGLEAYRYQQQADHVGKIVISL